MAGLHAVQDDGEVAPSGAGADVVRLSRKTT
jgi:hypothetical protein